VRRAIAQSQLKMNLEAYTKLKQKELGKGDAVTIAEVAGL